MSEYKNTYNQQFTLLIGLGGFGSRVVDNIYSRTKDKNNVSAFSIDTDIQDFRVLKSIPEQHAVSIAQHHTLFVCLNSLQNAREWFPEHPLLLDKTLNEGAGQVRAISRLAYELSLREQRFKVLLAEAYKMAKECAENDVRMRVSVVTSLVGGTGSGIFIQMALLIREYISKHFPSLDIKIHGEFILPSNFLFMFANPAVELRNMESNAYAALKELNAINEHFYSGAAPVELEYGYEHNINTDKTYAESLPYDYCFLYDRVNISDSFNGLYIEDAIIERLFSSSANDLNDAFAENICSCAKKAGNLYGAISTEKIPLDHTIMKSEIFRSIINRTSSHNGKRIFLISSPKKIDVDKAQFPKDTTVIERIDLSASEITITELCFGIEICEIEKLKYGSGQYYTSYHTLIDRLPNVISPHLNKNWHNELIDIGEAVDSAYDSDKYAASLHTIPKDSFVFVSYSSRELETANQLKHILETNGISCWMAPQSIPAGSDYAKEIPKAIDECKAFLLLLSDASQNSNWVPKEVGLAIGKGKIVVPFQIDNAAISEAFNFYLTNSQRISAYNRMTEAYQELVDRLKDILS